MNMYGFPNETDAFHYSIPLPGQETEKNGPNMCVCVCVCIEICSGIGISVGIRMGMRMDMCTCIPAGDPQKGGGPIKGGSF